jgi:hypothetical protein
MDTTQAQRNTHPQQSLNRAAFSATVHCLTGCSIGEILGMVVSTATGLASAPSIVLSVVLAFFFGYALTLRPIVSQLPLRRALSLALAADTVTIIVVELVDNGFVLAVPGAINAGLTDSLFWWSLLVGLVLGFAAAFPVSRALIARGRGHAVVHDLHQ